MARNQRQVTSTLHSANCFLAQISAVPTPLRVQFPNCNQAKAWNLPIWMKLSILFMQS